MLTAARRREKIGRQNRKEAAFLAVRKVNPLAAAVDADNMSLYPRDIADLAHRIERQKNSGLLPGEQPVTNAQRDLVAKYMPVGSLTNRHGESCRPHFSDAANV